MPKTQPQASKRRPETPPDSSDSSVNDAADEPDEENAALSEAPEDEAAPQNTDDAQIALYEAPQDVTTTGLDLKNNTPDDVTTYRAGSGTITYDPATKTVTLDNAEITLSAEAVGRYGKAALILPEGTVTLVVPAGTTSSITNIAARYNACSAVEAHGANLTVTGGGTLKLAAYVSGIDVYHNGSLTVEGTNLELNTGDQGVYSKNDVKILNSTITATGRGDNSQYASALDSTNGNIILTNSTVNVQDNYYYAVSADNCGALLMENSTLTVRNTTGAISVYPDGNDDDTLKNSIRNSTIDIQCNSGTPFVDEGATEIENSTVIMKTGGDNAFDHWYGGITIGGSSYVELEAAESALYIAKTADELALNDGLTVLEGEVTVHDGVKPKVTSTPRLVIGPMVKIDFDTAGGTEINPVSQGYGNKLTVPEAPEKYGHTFTGWYTDADCTTPWDFETDTVTGNLTLYAGWKPNRYAVTLDPNGGESETLSTEFAFGEALGTLPTPKKDGYTFDGWFDENGNAVTENTVFDAAQNVTLYAHWTAVPATPTATPEPTATPAPTNANNNNAPKTGDTFHAGAWLALFAGSAGTMAALFTLRKKHTK